MTNTIGRVNFTAVLDGKNMDRDAESVGRKAGTAAAAGYDKTWSQGFEDSLTKTGKEAYERWKKNGDRDGGIYASAMSERMNKLLREANKNFEGLRLDSGFLDDWNKKFDDAGLAAGELQKQIKLLEDAGGGNASAFRAARKQIDDWAESQRQAAIESHKSVDEQNRLTQAVTASASAMEDADRRQARLTNRLKEHTQARDNLIDVIREHNKTVETNNRDYDTNLRLSDAILDRTQKMVAAHHAHSFAWRDLSHNTRQWTLIIGAVLAAMEDLAVLGSAAGAGIIALGGAATAGVGGLGALVATFVTLNKDLKDLPAGLRPVAAEFKSFQGVFSDLREEIATGAFAEMDGVFDTFGDSIRALFPQFKALGTVTGVLFDDLAENTAQGTEVFEQIREAVRLAAVNFDGLGRASGTFAEALVRSMNRAQPLVADLVDWVSRLSDQFNDFSKSDGFTDWIQRSQTVWKSFGGLLDGVSRALNNLVDAESVNRTVGFLDNLTAFTPNLEKFLDILGKLDIAGLLAEGLRAFGEAVEPLAEPVGELAIAVNALLVDILKEATPIIAGVAQVLAPLVGYLADFVSALPDVGTAQGLLILTGALIAFKGAASLSATITSIQLLQTTLATTGKVGTVAAVGIGAAAKALGVLSLAVGGFALVDAWTDSLGKADVELENLARSSSSASAALKEIAEPLAVEWWGEVKTGLTDVRDALDASKASFESFGGAMNQTLGQKGTLDALKQYGEGLASLAEDDLPAARQGFQDLVREYGLTTEQQLTLIDAMGPFRDALLESAQAAGGAATEQDVLALAMQSSAQETAAYVDQLVYLAESGGATEAQIDDLSSAITDFQSAVFDSRDAAREYEAAIDDLTASVAENGTSLEITEEAGRKNQQAVDDLAQSVLNNTAKTLENTKSSEEATKVMETGRAKLIEMLAQFGITGQAAEDYADNLGLIPEDVTTNAELTGVTKAEADLAWVARPRTAHITVTTSGGEFSTGVGNMKGKASGGTLYGPEVILAGEAGPEAIVPLNRPLSQVDSSVRWLSAIAQGLTPTPMAAGGTAGSGTHITFAEGSVVAYETNDAAAVANEFVRQIFERVNG